MRLVLGSDLHGFLPRVPECDVLILAGDLLPSTNPHRLIEEQKLFVERRLKPWLERAPAKHIVATWGNHDWLPFYGWKDDSLMWNMLVDEGIILDGVRFYGSPWSLPFMRWAWMAPEETLEKLYGKIPSSTDVLITHTPAFGILDKNYKGENCGSKSLRWKLDNISKLKLAVWGHIHEAWGREGIAVNACCVYNFDGTGYGLRNNPWIIVDI
jgi:Icc-related predicted phosphoesterase